MKLHCIEWIDSETAVGWDKPEEHLNAFGLLYSVGFLVSQTEDQYVLAADYDPETGHYNRYMKIPVVCVRKVSELCEMTLK